MWRQVTQFHAHFDFSVEPTASYIAISLTSHGHSIVSPCTASFRKVKGQKCLFGDPIRFMDHLRLS